MAKSKKPTVLVGVPVPPPDSRPYVPGVTLPANREVDFLCLHTQVIGFMMHWIENQAIPCPVDRNWCAGCKLGQTPRWTGFIGVISLNSNNRFIARIPTAAYRESGLFRDRSDAQMLQGTVFTSWRFGARPTKTRPLVIEVKENTLNPRVKPFNLLAALARWWNFDSLDSVRPAACPAKENALPHEIEGISAEQWAQFRAACAKGAAK